MVKVNHYVVGVRGTVLLTTPNNSNITPLHDIELSKEPSETTEKVAVTVTTPIRYCERSEAIQA